jgi:hypothetical protein
MQFDCECKKRVPNSEKQNNTKQKQNQKEQTTKK